MSKVLAPALALCCAARLFSQEEFAPRLNMYNEVKTYSVQSGRSRLDPSDKNFYSKFGGIDNKTVIDAEFAPVLIHFKVIERIDANKRELDGNKDANGVKGVRFSKIDWNFVLRPWDFLNFYVNKNLILPGGYLPVYDERSSPVSRGSVRGLSAVLLPAEGLVIGANVPIKTADTKTYDFFNYDADGDGSLSDSERFCANGAAWYRFSLGGARGSLGASIKRLGYKNPSESLGIGIFASLSPVKGLNLYGGWGHNDTEGCTLASFPGGRNVAQAAATFSGGPWNFKAEGMTNFSGGERGGKKFLRKGYYAYEITRKFADGKISLGLMHECSSTYRRIEGRESEFQNHTLTPGLEIFPADHHSFKLTAELQWKDGDFFQTRYPISWKYVW